MRQQQYYHVRSFSSCHSPRGFSLLPPPFHCARKRSCHVRLYFHLCSAKIPLFTTRQVRKNITLRACIYDRFQFTDKNITNTRNIHTLPSRVNISETCHIESIILQKHFTFSPANYFATDSHSPIGNPESCKIVLIIILDKWTYHHLFYLAEITYRQFRPSSKAQPNGTE